MVDYKLIGLDVSMRRKPNSNISKCKRITQFVDAPRYQYVDPSGREILNAGELVGMIGRLVTLRPHW